jgi:hypothetical protein
MYPRILFCALVRVSYHCDLDEVDEVDEVFFT